MSKKSRKSYNVPPETFVAVWQSSNSAQEAADRLGMPKDIAQARASGYRNEGVRLKMMPRGAVTRKLSVPALNRLIDDLDNEMDAKRAGSSAQLSKDQVQEAIEKALTKKKRKKNQS